ncbi:hypothetical protein B0H15DRAFT_869610 [Mycena belliarum]|uniref:Uncharacterized protein n=1 Tax=Mycena belliarum TaxID=1033014 RepID=A0AAD6TPG4_9AGAR|nr:hypothetical protein B0H15DRAFT_869610 [Mycena belliae]
MTLLVKHDMYRLIKAQVLQLVHDNHLNRHKEVKIYYGRHELSLILSTMLDASRRTGRSVVLQNMIRYLIPFYFTTRASTMGPTHRKWRDLNYVPVLGDLRFFVRGYMDWDIEFRFKHIKNSINTVEAEEQTVNMTGCLYTHNLPFDITLPFAAHLFLLKRFTVKYETIEEFTSDLSAELQIDPAFADTPIFLAGGPGGREFAEPEVAATAASIYESLRAWGNKCGIPRAGVTALRRETSNMYSLQLGHRVAKDALHHATDGPFRNSYSRNLQNHNLVQIRLGEVAGALESFPGAKITENHKRHGFKSWAVEALIRREQEETPEGTQVKEDAKRARVAYKTSLLDLPDFKDVKDARLETWETYLRCYNATAAGYVIGTLNANRLFGLATGDIDPPKAEKGTPVAFKQPYNSEKTQPIRESFIEAETAFLKKQKHYLRQYDRGVKNEKNKQLLQRPLTGLAADRNVIVEALSAPDPGVHLKKALSSASAPPDLENLESLKRWATNLQIAQMAVSAIEDEGPGSNLAAQGDQDRLFAWLDSLSLNEPTPELASVATQRKAAKSKEDKEGPAAHDADDEDDTPGDDIDERSEEDILKIPVADARRALLEYYVLPVLAARAYAKYKVEDGYQCPRCSLYTHIKPLPVTILYSLVRFEEHILIRHSEWDDLELQIIEMGPDGASYHCPAGDFANAVSVKQVREHALSGNCVRGTIYANMARERAEATPIRHKNDRDDNKSSRLGRSRKANGLESDSEDSNFEGQVAVKVPKPAVSFKARVQDLIQTAASTSLDPDAAEAIADPLVKYVDGLPELGPARKGSKQPGEAEWDLLGLSEL